MHSLEMLVGIVDCNERCEDVLKKFLQAKGLWLFRWAQVRIGVWRGILQGSGEASRESEQSSARCSLSTKSVETSS